MNPEQLSKQVLKEHIPKMLPKVFFNQIINLAPPIPSKIREELFNKELRIKLCLIAYYRDKPDQYWSDLESYLSEKGITDLNVVAKMISTRIFNELGIMNHMTITSIEISLLLETLRNRNDVDTKDHIICRDYNFTSKSEKKKQKLPKPRFRICEKTRKDLEIYGDKAQQEAKKKEDRERRRIKQEKIERDAMRAVELGLEKLGKEKKETL